MSSEASLEELKDSMMRTARNLQRLCLERSISVDYPLLLLEAAEEGDTQRFFCGIGSLLEALAEQREGWRKSA
jgi:hypothetical protein